MSRRNENVKRTPYQPGDIQRRQQAVQESHRRTCQGNDIRSQRYQQEVLAGDWQQDWNRTPYDDRNDRRFTAGQFVLILVTSALVLALTGMAVFWYTGRSSLKKTPDSRLEMQQDSGYYGAEAQPADNITILDTGE